MAKHIDTPPYLKVIEGGKAAREERRRAFLKAGLATVGIMACGTALALANAGRHRGEEAHMMVGRGAVVITYSQPLPAGRKLSDRLDMLSNKELIGKLAREGSDLREIAPQHNMASLILEMRGEAAVPDMVQALANDPSPFVRSAIAYSLGRIGSVKALPALEKAAAEDSDPRARAAAEESARGIRAKDKD